MDRRGDARPWHRQPLFRLAAIVLVAAVLAGMTYAGSRAGVFAGFEAQTRDTLFPSGEVDGRVAVVGIDAASIREVGQAWPWSRAVHARLVEGLVAAGVHVVGYDVVLDLPGEGDQELASALRSADAVVLGVAADDLRLAPRGELLVADAVSAPVSAFAEEAAALGHVAVTAGDRDGVVRTVPLVIESPEGELLPALSAAAVTAAEGGDPSTPILRPDGVQFGDRFHPTEGPWLLRVNWAAGLEGPQSSEAYVSAADVLTGTAGDRLAGRIVFVGAVDPLLGDNELTPVAKGGAGTPGVFVHANAANTLLTGSYRYVVDEAAVTVTAFLVTVLVAGAVVVLPLGMAPLIALLAALGFVAFASWRFDAGESWGLVYPFLAIVLAAVAGAGLRYLSETRERRLVSALFSRYVPEAVARELIAAGRVRSAAEGERLEVSVLFCDIRGFTALARRHTPAEVREMLSLYYDTGTRVVLEHGGTLMQYVGDEIFAVFGAPLPQDDHAQRAVDAAAELGAAAGGLARALADRGLPGLRYGIGVHSGEVVAAHIGGGVRRQYGVVGDSVNVGSRLCGLAAGGEVLISGAARSRLLRTPAIEDVGTVELKGVGAVEVHRVVVAGADGGGDEPRSGDHASA